ncbi:unnamed protein product [Ilex paraguariensis]|uniref:Scarecrow-like protein 14 n=1 Tax=Ilex paraguariensis TaxID=185542 RepID=A0ABC8V1Q4_9AQUA
MNHNFRNYPVFSNDTHHEDVAPEEEVSVACDYFDGVFKYINQMLMEEDHLENKPCMFQDCSALQATEKSFHDVLVQNYPPPPYQNSAFLDQNADNLNSNLTGTCSSHGSNSSTAVNTSVESNWVRHQHLVGPFFGQSSLFDHHFQSDLQYCGSSSNYYNVVDGLLRSPVTPVHVFDSANESQFAWKNHLPEERSNKQLADYAEESDSEQTELYDKVLLCPSINPGLHDDQSAQKEARNESEPNGQAQGSKRGKDRWGCSKKQGNARELVDLRGLLTLCAQAVACFDSRTANELLKRIRQHCSSHGDGTERMAHYFSNALEARLAGTGTELYAAFAARRISAAEMLKAHRAYVTACPFQRMSNIFANKSIAKLAMGVTRLHIVDFGILYGFQWPCIMQGLSLRPGGPPKLRITGIDFPQTGFRPAERVEETGLRLANYCKRFNIPFEYNAIAKKWDTIQLDDIRIDRDEMLIVNCLYRLRNVLDETVLANNPRDAVLNLVRRMNPDMFMHGVAHGSYNGPYFGPRFREAQHHFSALFDMFDANMGRKDEDRLMFEREVFGREAMNVIACEVSERVERPETYKQWQARNRKAGFRQLPLDRDIMEEVRTKVKQHYHKDFVVGEDSNWMLQGWKGRVMYALSNWKPV